MRLAISPLRILRSNSIALRICRLRVQDRTVNFSMAATRRSSRLSSAAQSAAETQAMPPPPPQQNKRKRKSAADSSVTVPQPVTPTNKRTHNVAATAPAPPPLTPTPSAVGVIAQRAGGTKRPRHASVIRLADPEGTNATLLSPESSRVVASKDVEPESPTKRKAGGTGGVITTDNLYEKACAHLIKVDEKMRPLVEKNPCKIFTPEGLAERVDPFESLASGIISQQVSGAAARSIKAKFVALFAKSDSDPGEEQRFPHPSEVAAFSLETLRTAGLSQRKAEYIKGLAEKFASGELSAQMLHTAPYDELFDKLIAVRGLGRWSVEMFACFGLKRMDVFSVGDLGVQRGMAAFAGRDVARLKAKGGKWKYMTEQEMLDMSAPFAPYRTLFMWLMWRVEDSFTDVSTMES